MTYWLLQFRLDAGPPGTPPFHYPGLPAPGASVEEREARATA